MVNRKYNRIFVLMTGKNAGQCFNGSCDMEVIEGKGRLYAYVGKLNKLTYKPRKLYLISVGLMGSLAVSAGNLDPKGRNASIDAEFDPDDLFGSGMQFEEINAVAIWGEDDGPNNAVLEGFVSNRLDWHSNLEIFGETRTIRSVPSRPVIVNVAELQKEESTTTMDTTMEKTEKLCRSIIEEPELDEEIQDEIIDLNEDIEETEEPEIITEQIPENIADQIPENITEAVPENIIEAVPEAIPEKVKEKVKEEVNDLAEKLTENINKANLLKDLSAAEAMAGVSPHDTFRVIAQKFRRELDMLDEMGIIDKRMFFDEEESNDSVQPAEEVTAVAEAHSNDQKIAETADVKTERIAKTEAVPKEEPKIVEDNKIVEIKEVDEGMILTDRLFAMNDKLVTDDGREWVKIDYREAYFIEDAIRDIRSRFVKNAARKGRHMIIGRDGRSLFIGVPGKENERNYAELNGFYEFFTIKNLSCAGYWIKAI